MRRARLLFLLAPLAVIACGPARVNNNTGTDAGPADTGLSDVARIDTPAPEDVPTTFVDVPTPLDMPPVGKDVPFPDDEPKPLEDVPTPPVDVPTPLEDVPTPPVDVPTPLEDVLVPEDVPTPPVDVPTPPVDAPTSCRSDRDCSAMGMVCDTTTSRCVACLLNVDCPNGLRCVANACVPPCTSSTMCPGQVCDRNRGLCVDCVATNDCALGQRCAPDNRCVALACTPGTATCTDGNIRRACNSDGSASTDTPCPGAANATGLCSGMGLCTQRCATGFADCDGSTTNGCEASLNAATSCGACGRACSVGQMCVNGACVTSMDCPTGQTRCNGVCVNLLDNTDHCGRCSNACFGANSRAACQSGTCGPLTCNAGFGNCNNNVADGCEVNLNNSPAHCGRCGNVCLAGGLCTNGVCANTSPGATLVTGLGGRAGFGSSCLSPGDDSSWSTPGADGGTVSAIPVGAAFPNGINYYGQIFRSFYVNTNGNISFAGPLSTYTPVAFPQTNGAPMMAPFWGDVDTRGGNPPTTNNICFHTDSARTVVTWHQVGFFSMQHTLLNSFQLVLTPLTGADFTVEFRYNRCQWTTGDASGGTNGLGGTAAQAGFEGGMGRGFVLPGSRTMQVLNLCSTSNVGQPGVWRYTFRGGLPVSMN